MSHPFNFYQDSGLGLYPNLWSGAFTPTGMLETPWHFQARVDHEVFEYRPTVEVNISGKQDKGAGLDYSYNQIVFSGSMFGVKSGVARTEIKFTGQQSNHPLVVSNSYVKFTGQQSSHAHDINDFYVGFTGRVKEEKKDSSEMVLSLSGNQVNALRESGLLGVNLTGNFIKSNADNVSFSVAFSGAEWDSYRPRARSSIGSDAASMGVLMARIVWSRAGG